MKLKLFISILIIFQISGCAVYEEQSNESIQAHNQGIENRVASLEREIDILKQELNQLTLKNNQLEMIIEKGLIEKSKEKLNNSENA